MTEYEACYVFGPGKEDESSQPPSKRRKSEQSSKSVSFVPLFRGEEQSQSVKSRYETFAAMWGPQETKLNDIIHRANIRTVDAVASFVEEPIRPNSKISAGLMVAGPGNGTTLGLFESIAERVNLKERAQLVNLNPVHSSNLKTVLKQINRSTTARNGDFDDNVLDDEIKGGRLLNYDLKILHDHVHTYAIRKVMISITDSEAFNGGILSDLIEVLSSWSGRIPFVLLFGIETSIELFQSKISRSAVRCLQGKQFELLQVDTKDMFQSLHRDSPGLYLGPALSGVLLERQKDYIQSPSSFIQALKYAYMTHFFSNPLSLCLDPEKSGKSWQPEFNQAIRSLPSFQLFLIQDLVGKREYATARDLLNEENSLKDFVIRELKKASHILSRILAGIQVATNVEWVLNYHMGRTSAPWSELYIQAMSGDLLGSSRLEEAMSSVKKIKSNVMEDLIEKSVGSGILPKMHKILYNLKQLTHDMPNSTALRSAYDIQHSNVRTTVVAQKVELSKHAAELTPKEAQYTTIVDQIYSAIVNFYDSHLVDPQKIFLNEILIYDSKSPHREVFSPRPRFAIERALSYPHDYLGCDCCGMAEDGLSATQPATAILYQLYLESGGLINAADLWSAFWTIVGPEESEDEESEQPKALALFSRALAELKFLGMVKNSKKKADHLAKLSWKGL